MRTTIEHITPTNAALMLRKNLANRSLSKTTVSKYAQAMRRGEWLCNGESIVFDDAGNLSNGQHRLHACVQADVAFETVVVYGSPLDAFKTFDGGKVRNVADVLSIQGEKNTSLLASAARTYVMLQLEGRARYEITTVQTEKAVQDVPALARWTNEFAKTTPRLFPASLVGIVAHVDRLHGCEVAQEFFGKCMAGVGLSTGDPELVLRDKFIKTKFGIKFDAHMARAYMIKAANARISGKKIAVLRMTAEESYPVLAGM